MYLIDMFNLAGPFEAIVIHLQEGDTQCMKPSFDIFRSQYDNVSQMVPEWTKAFPMNPVTNLGKRDQQRDADKIVQAMGAVGQVCSDCHLVYQVKVQQKYHWRDFDAVKMTNPVTHQEQDFGEYMTTMAGAFEGALVDLQETQLDKARANFAAFQSEFTALAEKGCKQCHSDPVTHEEIPRNYYVDNTSMAVISRLRVALDSDPPDFGAIGDLSAAIGNSICFNCHLVHLPAQDTKDIWSQYSKMLK